MLLIVSSLLGNLVIGLLGDCVLLLYCSCVVWPRAPTVAVHLILLSLLFTCCNLAIFVQFSKWICWIVLRRMIGIWRA